MRRDMFKVIVERPRTSGHSHSNLGAYTRSAQNKAELKRLSLVGYDVDDDGERYIPDDFLTSFEPIKSKVDAHRSTNENLSPLYRFLEKNVGRPWDDVYSEIRESLKMDSAVQLHVVQHVKWAVTLKTFIGNDGHVYDTNQLRYFRDVNEGALDLPGRARDSFYVHPETKLLCVSPVRTKKEWKAMMKPITVLFLSKYRQFRLIDGNWMVVELEDVRYGAPEHAPDGTFVKVRRSDTQFVDTYLNYSFPDVLFPNGLTGEKRMAEYGEHNLYALCVRKPGARELKQFDKLMKQAQRAQSMRSK